MKVTLIRSTVEPEELVAVAARLCYSQNKVADIQADFGEGEAEHFVELLANMGHESPIEHAVFTFAVEGVSRSLSHQLVRHRIASYSQRSQRYTTTLDGEYVIPEEIRKRPALKRLFEEHMAETTAVYRQLVKGLFDSFAEDEEELTEKKANQLEKKALENARAVLPNATKTSLIVTQNARTLIHFFNVRCCNRAQDEIRELAILMRFLCIQVAPSLFANCGPDCFTKGKCGEGAMSCGKPFEG